MAELGTSDMRPVGEAMAAEEMAEMLVTDVIAKGTDTGNTDPHLALLVETDIAMSDTVIVRRRTLVAADTTEVLARLTLTTAFLFLSVRHRTFRTCKSSRMRISIATS
jgi:hypothetical protein